MRRLLAVAVVLLSAAILFLVFARTEKRTVDRQDSCGPKCLFVAGRQMGAPLQWNLVASYFRDGSSGGTTLRQLDQAANFFKMKAKLQQSSWTELLNFQGVAILFVNGNHFLSTIRQSQADTENGVIRVYDPNARVYSLTRTDLEAMWSGEGLFIDQQPAFDGLKYDSLHVDKGVVEESLEVEHSFSIINVNSVPISLKINSSSCSCTASHLSKEDLLPGEEGILTARIDLSGKMGRFNESVILQTSDTDLGLLQFSLSGLVPVAKRLSTDLVTVNRVRPGSEVVSHLCVHADFDKPLGTVLVNSMLSVPVEGSSEQPKCRFVIRSANAVDSTVRNHVSAADGDILISAVVEIPSGCLPGAFEFSCTAISDQSVFPKVPFKIAGSVVGDIVADPAALVVRLDPVNRKGHAETLLRSQCGTPLGTLQATTSSSMGISVQIENKETEPIAKLSLTVDGDTSPAHSEAGNVTCRTSDGRLVEIPYLILHND